MGRTAAPLEPHKGFWYEMKQGRGGGLASFRTEKVKSCQASNLLSRQGSPTVSSDHVVVICRDALTTHGVSSDLFVVMCRGALTAHDVSSDHVVVICRDALTTHGVSKVRYHR